MSKYSQVVGWLAVTLLNQWKTQSKSFVSLPQWSLLLKKNEQNGPIEIFQKYKKNLFIN